MKSCGTAVQNSLRSVPGVQSATVDFAAAEATIQAPASVSVAALINAVEVVGFDAVEKEAPEAPVTTQLAIDGMMW